MRQGFWGKICEISGKDILHILLFLIAYPVARIYRMKRRDLWLICENAMEATDNGFWLYRYIRKNEPEQDVVYAIKRKSKDYNKVAMLGPVVEYGSLKHWIYYLAAEKNISTQKGGKPNAAVCYFLEVYGILRNTRIFLQHGIIMNDLPFLHYENAKITMFVCTTKNETQFVQEKFHYPKRAVQKLGICRLDGLHEPHLPSGKILIMPTWRGWLSPPSNGRSAYTSVEKIKETEYYIHWNQLIHNQDIADLLEQHNLNIIFYLHREMQKFTNLFESQNNRIEIATSDDYQVQELLIEADYLITDYSSVAMDFGYMKKPLLYYQFDYEHFRAEHYPEGYFSYELDGFGAVCYNMDTVLQELKRAAEQNFTTEEAYLRRHEKFFDLFDTDNCKRNYEAIKAL